MQSDTLSYFSHYIEMLARRHKDIRHTNAEMHFIELASDQQFQKMKSLVYPVVAFDRLTITYNMLEDAERKNRYVEIMFLDKCPVGEFARIKAIKDKMEQIAEDFLIQIRNDRKKRNSYKFLRSMQLDSAEVNYVENESIGIFGVLLSVNVDSPMAMCFKEDPFLPSPGTFDDSFDKTYN